MNDIDWVFAYASVIGNSHIAERIPCQDSSVVKKYDGYIIAVICDGAGSCENSHMGAGFVSEKTIILFEKVVKENGWTEDNLPTNDEWYKLARKSLANVRKDLDLYSMSNDMPFKSLSCTVIVVIAFAKGLLVTHIGDGRAGYYSTKGWHPIIKPFHGNEANETVFITSEIWDAAVIDSYIESTVIRDKILAFCLMSDGCEKAAFECNLYDAEKQVYYDPNRPFPAFFNNNMKALKKLNAEGKSQEEINNLWIDFLKSGNDKLRVEPDDKSLILGVVNDDLC